MVKAPLTSLPLAMLALGTAACSVIYDPSQFRTTDAGRDSGRDELDAPGADATMAEPDALPLDMDAPLLDMDAPAADAASIDTGTRIDASTPDAPIDASRDAFGPDATGECPLPASSTALPICSDTFGLYYCPANDREGDLALLSEEIADVAVPATGHRLGILGNAIEAWRGTRLTDFELVREADRLGVLASEGAILRRHTYDVEPSVLGDRGSQVFVGPPGALEVGDIAVAQGMLGGVAVVARDTSGWAGFTCPMVDTACNRATSELVNQPTPGTQPLLAYAGTTLVAQLPTTPERDRWLVQRLDPAPHPHDTFMGPEPERLRSVGTELVFADGDATVAQRAYEPDDSTMRALTIGDLEPRIATVTPTTHVIGRAREVSGGLMASVVGLDCMSVACTCRPRCDAMGVDEAFVPIVGIRNLVDWTLQVVDDDLRVGIFLVGDTSGTDVLVAWWRPGATITVTEPVIVASGRVSGVAGVGHSVRSVARRIRAGAIDRLEVFVAVHVTVDPQEFVFLSGLRLEGCGS